ncbi:hypothetical protein BKA70DRAFT_871424 [Coprinopsis sp. MPI-PUGE-AT-0042]|nr:hypothetical protein BKA70DRAFT_871424 [Coprinopsis sp. MPI-PUGE-AT-0042]
MPRVIQKSQENLKDFRSTRFYIQTVIIKVEERLYSIPKDTLTSLSPVFEGMFDVGDHSEGEGTSDETPIVLEGYKSDDFDCLLKILLPRPFENIPPSLLKQEWISVLKLATIWQIDQARSMAIDQLSAFDLSPVEQVQHAREYHISAWFQKGIVAIAKEFGEYDLEELGKLLGWKNAAIVLSLREQTMSKVKAMPAVPQGVGWAKDWECACGAGLDTGVLYISKKQFLQCSARCDGSLFNTKQPIDKAADGPPVPSTRVEISEDVVLAAFAEEIKVLDALQYA